MRRCQQHEAPQYLIDCVTPARLAECSRCLLAMASRQRLHSASRHQLLVPRYQLSSLGRRSFAVAVAGIRCRLTFVTRRVVTSLSDVLWKHFCSLSTSVSSALDDELCKSTLTIYLSNYLEREYLFHWRNFVKSCFRTQNLIGYRIDPSFLISKINVVLFECNCSLFRSFLVFFIKVCRRRYESRRSPKPNCSRKTKKYVL